MSSVRSFSTAAPAPAEEESGWTRVGPTRSAGWGVTARPTPDSAPLAFTPAPTRAGFSFASSATAAALDNPDSLPPRAPSSRTISTGPPPPKPAGSWGAARPIGAVAAAKDANKTLNIQSLSEFPTLGGGARSRSSTTVAAPAPTWSRTVTEASARVDAEAAAAEEARQRREALTQRRSRLANIGSRCFDDSSPACDTYPDEDEEDDAAGYYREMAVRPEDAGDGEFNSDLMSTRRAGDKGDW
jgi:hypothetical protein